MEYEEQRLVDLEYRMARAEKRLDTKEKILSGLLVASLTFFFTVFALVCVYCCMMK